MTTRRAGITLAAGAGLVALSLLACGSSPAPAGPGAMSGSSGAAASTAAAGAAGNAVAQAVAPSDALPADKTVGFDGARAYEYTAKLVSFGPRPPDSDGIHRAQDFIRAELKNVGCAFDEDNFHSSTPIGDVAMKNIIAKIPGKSDQIILLMTHYDTLKKDGFVGAVDGGSSTGLMLEMARELCAAKTPQPLSVWIAFLDGEEAFVQWSDTDSVYGSRQLAAQMALSGDLKKIKAAILADMVGPKDLQIRRESQSMGWLTNLVWAKAAELGYSKEFEQPEMAVDDDHMPFIRRHVAAVDIIDLAGYQEAGYWHTNEDTMDKVSARSLGIVGHVILATVNDLQGRTAERAKNK